jgi:hypothetical protein
MSYAATDGEADVKYPCPPPIVVYSHLRWNWVYQRPQHIVSRLAQPRRVLFVEEPSEVG